MKLSGCLDLNLCFCLPLIPYTRARTLAGLKRGDEKSTNGAYRILVLLYAIFNSILGDFELLGLPVNNMYSKKVHTPPRLSGDYYNASSRSLVLGKDLCSLESLPDYNHLELEVGRYREQLGLR